MRITDNYVFFFKGILGNWHLTDLTWNGLKFFSSEHLFMYLKALHFEDEDSAKRILHAKNSRESQALGRQIRNFNQRDWDAVKSILMYEALSVKCNQNKEFEDTLRKYKGKTFVECNPIDHIWAIGKDEYDKSADDPNSWEGSNVLGFLLTKLSKTL